MAEVEGSIMRQMAKKAAFIDLNKLKADAIRFHKDEILDLNREQLREGQGSHNSPIGRYINRRYMTFKSRLSSYLAGLPTPDLFVKGGFHAGLRLSIRNDKVRILKSASDKTPYWWLKVYRGIFGLSDKSMNEIKPKIGKTYFGRVMEELIT